MVPQLAGQWRPRVGDRSEVRAEARLVSWWLEAPFWWGLVPPQGVAFLPVIVGDVYEALVAGDGGLDGFRGPAVEGARVGSDPGGGAAPVWDSAVVGAGSKVWLVREALCSLSCRAGAHVCPPVRPPLLGVSLVCPCG